MGRSIRVSTEARAWRLEATECQGCCLPEAGERAPALHTCCPCFAPPWPCGHMSVWFDAGQSVAVCYVASGSPGTVHHARLSLIM